MNEPRLTIPDLIAADSVVADIFAGAELGNVQDMNPRWELFIHLMMARQSAGVGSAGSRPPAYLSNLINDPTVNVSMTPEERLVGIPLPTPETRRAEFKLIQGGRQ